MEQVKDHRQSSLLATEEIDQRGFSPQFQGELKFSRTG